MTPNKEFFVNAALAVASFLFTLVLLVAAGELFLRWQYGAVPPGPPNEMRTYDEGRGWALRPGRYSYFDVKAARRVDVAINELGLRNGPLAREPKPGVERIMVLGDSFVFGAPVNEGDIMTARLQALAGSSFEVVNVAVPGYGTGQQYRLVEELQAKGYRLGRKVVLAFFTNDIQDNVGVLYGSLTRNPAQPAFSIDPAGNLQQTPTDRAQAFDGRGPRRLHGFLFLHFLRYRLEVLMVSYPRILTAVEAVGIAPALPRTPGIVAGWHGAEWEARWRVTEGVLEHLVTKLRATPEAPQLFIAFVPSAFQVHEWFKLAIAAGADSDARYASFMSDPDRSQRLLRALAQRLDVRFIDLTPALRWAAASSVVYFPREGHFNEAGSAIAARVIYEQAIVQEDIVPER